MGTLPLLTDAGAIEAHLKRARPVGVARLVIIDRRNHPQDPTIDDVVFISRAISMWSTASPTRNYSISRLLFSLRNTPHRKAVKAYGSVYAPRNELSSSMWAEGARAKRLDEMNGASDRHREPYNACTSHGAPPVSIAGTAAPTTNGAVYVESK